MNYVDLIIGIITVLLAIAMFWASAKENGSWQLGLCFLLVSVLTLNYGVENITKAYNKINHPCELAQGCVEKEVSV